MIEYTGKRLSDPKRSVKIDDKWGFHLYTMTNGQQWSACRVDDVEMAQACIEVL